MENLLFCENTSMPAFLVSNNKTSNAGASRPPNTQRTMTLTKEGPLIKPCCCEAPSASSTAALHRATTISPIISASTKASQLARYRFSTELMLAKGIETLRFREIRTA